MEVRKLLSRWWFVALVSLAIGIPATLLVLSLAWRSVIPSMLSEGPSAYRLLFMISFFMIYAGYLISFICLFLTFGPRHVINGGRFLGPDDLVRAGYQVARRKGSFDVRVAKYSVLRIYEGERTFRCLPTSTALWALVIVFMSGQLVVFAFPIILYVHNRCWKGLEAVIVEEGGSSAHDERDVADMVEDSLMGAYLLAREAANIKRSAFHDHVIIIVVFALASWVALLALSVQDIVGDRSFQWLGLGTLLIAVVAITGALILQKRSMEEVKREERWAERLLSAIRKEDGVGSPIELLLCACNEVPRWLAVQRKGIWFREPGKTLLIFILLYLGVSAVLQYNSIWWGFLLFGLICLAIGTFLFLKHIISAGFESRDMVREWDRRISEMDSLLEPGQER
ncbi:MAG: hypothetical protein E4H30_00935 [Methanomassiliicoccus sp.]|nr:MAG: hypothetical protein E4H30_00935 [Methanomassiliicoccus sp.]